MGRYITNSIDEENYKLLIQTIRNGYTDKDGHKHRPNNQIANILVLEANLGCRIGDIIKLRTDSFILDGNIWKLNIVEEKTKKKRTFIVPKQTKSFIDNIADGKDGYIFTVKEPAVWKCLRQVTEFLGIENCSSHSFRKYCANSLYESTGHDIEAVCTFLQHSCVTTTRRYIRRSDAKLEKAINEIVSIV